MVKPVDGPVGGGRTASYRPPEAVAIAYLHSVRVCGGFRAADTAKHDTSGFRQPVWPLSSQRGNRACSHVWMEHPCHRNALVA